MGINIIKAGTAKVTDRQLKSDAKDSLMQAMVDHTANAIHAGDVSQGIASHVLVVAIKAMNVGADSVALEASVDASLADAMALLVQADDIQDKVA